MYSTIRTICPVEDQPNRNLQQTSLARELTSAACLVSQDGDNFEVQSDSAPYRFVHTRGDDFLHGACCVYYSASYRDP